MIDEGQPAFDHLAGSNLADEHPVIAGLDCLPGHADRVGSRVLMKDRTALDQVWRAPGDAFELLFGLGGVEDRQMLATARKKVHCEAAGGLQGRERVRRLVDTDEYERGLQRDGAEGAQRESSRFAVSLAGRDDRHPGREAGHDVAVKLLGDGHRRKLGARLGGASRRRDVPCYHAQVVRAEFVPERASQEEWRRYHDFRRRSHEEWRPGEPLEPDEVAQALLCTRSRFSWDHHWQVTVGSQMLSELGAETVRPESPEYETNRHLLWAWVWVLEPYRRRGIGRAWIPKVLELMDEYGCMVLSMGAEQESGHAFIRSLGAE